MRQVKKIAITGGAGQIAYSLLFRLANGDFLGPDQPLCLHLLEIPGLEKALEGVKMELEDSAFPLLKEIKIGSSAEKMFEGIDYAFLIGSKPRGPGMERKELLSENGKIFVEQGKALGSSASPDVKVLVVGNPCNTNCLIALHHAKNLPKENFYAMTRLDQNRAVFQLANKAGVSIEEVSHVTIWGNHSSTQVPDFLNAKIQGKCAKEKIDASWLETEFISSVQKRGAQVIETRGKSSAASAANAAIGAMRSMVEKTLEGHWFSSGVYAKSNPYGIQEDLVFSFPCRSQGEGKFEIVKGLQMDAFLEKRLRVTEKELLEERDLIRGLLS